ncbi:acyltransferase [Taibaiella soli]|uniref:Acyltransferase n=1 Tax=Taibaiella soli TaxID=1649169 RepID=A0A2W2AEP7_9BACT|nr:acyltransferase [Taibaiella soli]PZF72042.1 acyltransferase [Taibaiella soli]
MKISNLTIGADVVVDPTSSINNITIGNATKVAKYCSLYGAADHPLEIGKEVYVGMFSIINGYAAKIKIGNNVSIAQHVNIMADSGPNASVEMQKYFPLIQGAITIGDHCWLGANCIIMPGVQLGEFTVVAANSFVNTSFPPYSVIGGNPAKLIRTLKKEI